MIRQKLNENFLQLTNEMIDAFSIIIDPDKILDYAVGRIKDYFQLNNITLVKINDIDSSSDKTNIVININSRLYNWFVTNEKELEVKKNYLGVYIDEELKQIENRIKFQSRLIIPLISHNTLTALVFIGENPINDDVKKIITLLKLASLSFQNSCRILNERKILEEKFLNDKMITLGRAASSIAHEIKNPLTSIRSTIQLIGSFIEDSEIKSLSINLLSEVDRITKITSSLNDYTKEQLIYSERKPLLDILTSLESQYSTLLKNEKISLEIETANYLIDYDFDKLKQVFINLFENSIHAIKDSKKKKIIISSDTKDGNLCIKFIDSGIGIDKNDLKQIFDPFFTKKKLGTGLGLTIVKKILDKHKFHCEVRSKIDVGTEIIITIPEDLWENL
ncbi:MAG: GHKL domain-containing protein [Candidatus Delongbacteria bacterium]|nr:GHKL domain-containing protein [Candidatus Delongbacteria bacterium]MBN2834712.1 GHKL domain-containing protein [Candidatus Delongbacteria bacterium]